MAFKSWELNLHWVRLGLDLQYRSICQAVARHRRDLPREGVVLDVGAGHGPYRRLLPPGWRYVAVDPHAPGADYRSLEELPDGFRADLILLIEVLEHVPEPESFLAGLRHVLAPEGRLWLSVPFAARVHPDPEDFGRWTATGLRRLFERTGWSVLSLEARGGDFSSLVARVFWFFASRLGHPVWLIPALIALIGIVAPLLVLAQLALALRVERTADPLGYFTVLK